MKQQIQNKTASRHPLWLSTLLPTALIATTFLFSACLHESDSDNGSDSTESADSEENDGDTVSGAENDGATDVGPQTLFNETIHLKADTPWDTPQQEAPANGEISAVVMWTTPGTSMSAVLFEGSAARRVEQDQTQRPITFSHPASGGSNWGVGLLASRSGTVQVTISFAPNE